jgi:hypothetical protein
MAKTKIPAKTKKLIRAKYTHCVCCGQWDGWDCGHIISEKRGGSIDESNLVKMCARCNGALGDSNARFSKFATYSESRPEVETNRAGWFLYCDAENKFWDASDNLAKGKIKQNPYRRPQPYSAAI